MKGIIEFVDRFINERKYPYALMINGKWGCGKTFFVRKQLIPHIQASFGKRHDVNYISLYGVKSSGEISRRILVEAYRAKVPSKAKRVVESKVWDVASVIASSAIEFGLKKTELSGSGIKKLIKLIPNYNNNVLIFDDLERCGCDINEVLGFINSFVEHSNASIILIANEDEIGKWQFERNPELQTLVAIDQRVDVEFAPTYKEQIYKTVHGDDMKKESFSIDQIKQRKQAIFTNDKYFQIKEKVVGVTIEYEPRLEDVFSSLIREKIDDESLKAVLQDLIEVFVDYAKKDEHSNIRTFLSFLEKASVIYSITEGKYNRLYDAVFRYTYRSLIRYKKGLRMPDWEAEYGDQDFSGMGFSFNNEYHVLGFRFIDEYIKTNLIDYTTVNHVLNRYQSVAVRKGSFINDPYQKLKYWYDAEDDEVLQWLNEVEKNVQGAYSTELYPELVYTMAILKTHHVMEEKCEEIFRAMEDHIREANYCDLEEFGYEQFLIEGEAREEYVRMRSCLEKSIKDSKIEGVRQEYNDAIGDRKRWATNLVELLKENSVIRDHSFIFWIEPEIILRMIGVSKNSELDKFRQALQYLYGKHIYYEKQNDDRHNLEEIRNGLKNMDKSNWGEIKKNYAIWILNDIEKYLQGMNQDNNHIE